MCGPFWISYCQHCGRLLWFSIFSIVAGVCVYLNQALFLFARILRRIGLIMLLLNGLALLGALYQLGRKVMPFAIFGAITPNAAARIAVFAAILLQLPGGCGYSC